MPRSGDATRHFNPTPLGSQLRIHHVPKQQGDDKKASRSSVLTSYFSLFELATGIWSFLSLIAVVLMMIVDATSTALDTINRVLSDEVAEQVEISKPTPVAHAARRRHKHRSKNHEKRQENLVDDEALAGPTHVLPQQAFASTAVDHSKDIAPGRTSVNALAWLELSISSQPCTHKPAAVSSSLSHLPVRPSRPSSSSAAPSASRVAKNPIPAAITVANTSTYQSTSFDHPSSDSSHPPSPSRTSSVTVEAGTTSSQRSRSTAAITAPVATGAQAPSTLSPLATSFVPRVPGTLSFSTTPPPRPATPESPVSIPTASLSSSPPNPRNTEVTNPDSASAAYQSLLDTLRTSDTVGVSPREFVEEVRRRIRVRASREAVVAAHSSEVAPAPVRRTVLPPRLLATPPTPPDTPPRFLEPSSAGSTASPSWSSSASASPSSSSSPRTSLSGEPSTSPSLFSTTPTSTTSTASIESEEAEPVATPLDATAPPTPDLGEQDDPHRSTESSRLAYTPRIRPYDPYEDKENYPTDLTPPVSPLRSGTGIGHAERRRRGMSPVIRAEHSVSRPLTSSPPVAKPLISTLTSGRSKGAKPVCLRI